MKNKPLRHKESNTFKFKPFSERVNEIDVDIFHKVSHRNEEVTEEAETFFYQCLHKWNFLNLSENYTLFRKEVLDIITLPQLLNRKQYVIDTLLKYIKLRDPLCLQSIFELVIAVAKDLQFDFYPYFPCFLEAIVELLNVKDAEQLEYTFTTLAYLFKFQWRYMIKNVDKIFNLLVPLLADSKPAYITNFAAESFAFVVRKVKDKPAFLKLVLESLENKPNGVVGCGTLLFQVLAGITGQFHSCAESMLGVYLDSFQNVSMKQELLFEVLCVIFKCITKEIHYSKCDVLWTVIFKYLDKLTGKSLFYLLRLVQVIINYKEGQMVRDPVKWSRKLVDLMQRFSTDDEVLEEISNAAVATLLAPSVKLIQEVSSLLIIKLMSIEKRELLLRIIEDLIPHSSFDILVIPYILKSNKLSILDDSILNLLVKIINAKSPPALNGIELDSWIKYSLNICSEKNFSYISNLLDSLQQGNIKENSLKILIVLPHLTNLQEQLYKQLIQCFSSLYKQVQEITMQQQKINFAFLLATECIAHKMDPDEFHNLLQQLPVSGSELISTVLKHENDVAMLNVLSLCFTYLKSSKFAHEYINTDIFDQIHQQVTCKLGSPNSSIRLVVSQLISLFSTLPSTMQQISLGSPVQSVLELPLLAEQTVVTVNLYRERLLHVQALEYNSPQLLHLNTKYYDIPLNHLFGTLYINFSLIWEPVIRVIASYANKDCEQFWPLFMKKLKNEDNVEMVKEVDFDCIILGGLQKRVFELKDKVDVANYRLLLWKCMEMITGYCEIKNRDFVGTFIEFVEGNFFRSDSEDAKSCSIKRHSKDCSTIAEDNYEDLLEDTTLNEENEEYGNESEIKIVNKINSVQLSKTDDTVKVQTSRTERVKLLLAMLHVFSKFTNSRSIYREPEVLRIYLDLLSSKNSDIQKAALNCLYTYKYKYLMPYKDNLDSIVTEQNFKSELGRFQISVGEANEAVVREEHREGLMPILMRILHAKMSQRVGMRTGGKAGGLVKRKTILRFLAGIKEDEMMIFVRMAFKPFQNYLPILKVDANSDAQVYLSKMVHEIMDEVDLESVIPPKRLQSAVNLLAIIIEQFGGKMTQKLLPHLLAILICILAKICGILGKTEDIHAGYLPAIKNVRNNCLNVFGRFFQHFENYNWSSDEIDALFDVAIFPWVEKLPIEAIHSPTPLLKIFASWSHCPRYYPFFVKLNNDNSTPLVFIVKLMLNSKTQKSVQQMILEILEKLLTLQDYEKADPDQMDIDEEKPKSLMPTVTNKLETVISESINYGSAILLPHVTDILKYLERKLKGQTRQGANRTELVILSRISEFVTDPATCDTLLTLVMPIVQKKSGDSEEVVMQLLTTVTNLVKHALKPETHLRSIQHLLSQIAAPPARKMLLSLLEEVARDNEEMKNNQRLLLELNAYDQRWIDQPDYERRLNAFKLIDSLMKDEKLMLDFGVAIILNCFFFLRTENDLAMRDRSGQCLKSVGVYLAKMFNSHANDRKYLIEDTILTMVRHGIRSKNDNLKQQSIAFLGHVAMECPEIHPVLRDLNSLTNKQDPEVDFFENIQHLQLHRKGRALLKFCTIAKTWKKAPNPRTLTQFILPLATSYLCNDKFANKNSIIDAAIDTIGVACKLLPWNQYEVVLKYYLDKLRTCMDYQKQVIRIVVAILDSFHFDLSKLKDEQSETRNLKEPQFITEKIAIKEQPTAENTLEESSNKVQQSLNECVESADQSDEINDENLDEALKEADELEEEKSDEPQLAQTVEEIPAVNKVTILSKYMAKRLVQSISRGHLPQLHRAITVHTRYDGAHKVNKKRVSSEQEEDDLMRVPIALAMVKLLQNLPHGMLDSNLRGIFMKICTFLKSRLESVRRTTREILQKIMTTLGPSYLHHLLKEMNSLLTRGFHVHVLVFTMHAVLVCLKPSLEPKHIAENLSSILSVCKIDLFGPSAEEKEIAGIVRNTSEARVTKSFDIFHILGEFTGEDSIIGVVQPLKDVLERTNSYKNVRKVTESLRLLSLGLADNKFVPIAKLVDFLYGVTNETIPQLMPEFKRKQALDQKKKKKAEATLVPKNDCLLIQPAPKNKMGIKASAKTSKNTNAHVLIEFGLKLFHILLKRDKLKEVGIKTQIDSFVLVLANCLDSQHVKLSTLALQCLSWILKMNLPSLTSLVPQICKSIFTILHKYAVAGLSKGDNYDLVMAAFKAMSVLVRDFKSFVLSTDQSKALLAYAEQNIHDSERQATAFSLLKSIIYRKLMVPDMYVVMEKVAMLSVTSELENVRKQSRVVLYAYLVGYPLGKHLEKHISFYVNQLSYELQPGRMSVLEMLHGIITGFPLPTLEEYSALLFLTIGARLVNDEDALCKKMCSKCIKDMLIRLEHNQRNKLIDIVVTWMKDKKVAHRRLAVQLCGIFVTVEKDAFESRLDELLPLLSKQFYATEHFDDEKEAGRFVRLAKAAEEEIKDSKIKDPERLKDHHLFQVLQLLLKICANCTAFLSDKKYQEHINNFAEYSQSLLAHPHLWVRLAASQMLGFILASLDTEKIIHLLENPTECNSEEDGFIYVDPEEKLRCLILDSVAQLQPDTEFEELYNQIIKNLVFIARLLRITNEAKENEDNKVTEETFNNDISLLWLMKRLRRCVNLEVTQAPKSTIVRSSVFKWIAGVVATVEIQKLKPVLFHFMSPLVREMATTEVSNAPLRQLAKEVATMMKKKIDVDEYSLILTKAQQKLDMRRAEMKAVRSRQFVTNPDMAYKRKIAKQQKKKAAKKRKMENMKGKKSTRKRVKRDTDMDAN